MQVRRIVDLSVPIGPDTQGYPGDPQPTYRPLADDTTRVELAAAWRRDDDRPVLARALDVIRRDLHKT